MAPLLKQKIGTLFLRDPHANRVKMTLCDIVSQLEVTLITPQKEWHFVCYFFFQFGVDNGSIGHEAAPSFYP